MLVNTGKPWMIPLGQNQDGSPILVYPDMSYQLIIEGLVIMVFIILAGLPTGGALAVIKSGVGWQDLDQGHTAGRGAPIVGILDRVNQCFAGNCFGQVGCLTDREIRVRLGRVYQNGLAGQVVASIRVSALGIIIIDASTVIDFGHILRDG